jgi:peptidoglycan/LPS O-acetylase OafA/YrhL
MTDAITSPFVWWRARRFRYNVALVVAGILAFVAYVAVCVTLLPKDAEVEITLFTILFQGVGYLFMIGVANVCYFIGPLSERFVRPAEPERYRLICYRLGFWFSVLLPFSIPALLAFLAIFHPTYWSHSS